MTPLRPKMSRPEGVAISSTRVIPVSQAHAITAADVRRLPSPVASVMKCMLPNQTNVA